MNMKKNIHGVDFSTPFPACLNTFLEIYPEMVLKETTGESMEPIE